MPQKFNPGGGDSQRPTQQERADCIGSDDDGDERQKGVVDKGAAVNSDFVETKKEGN